MFKKIRSLRPLAAPATALVLVLALFILEDRHFDQKSALLLALGTGVAVAEMLPAAALALVFTALVLQSLKVFPLVFQSGALNYAVVPVVIFFAVTGWQNRGRRVPPVAAVVFAGIVTATWFSDQNWINFVFGTQIYGRGLLRTLTYAFLIFGAFAALNLAAWAAGTAVNNASRSQRAQAAAEDRLRATATELAVEQERNRIASELHDVLAHSLTVIVAQADGMRFIHRAEPGAVDEAAAVIAASARTALVETRRLVERFSPAPTDPHPRPVEELEELAARLATSGMPVRVEATGQPWALAGAQRQTVYRLAQESLTNAFKHADRSRGADLRLRWGADALELHIESALIPGNAASPSPSPHSPEPGGRGIPGMRARAAAAGGRLETVLGEQTFSVLALLPRAVAGPETVPGRVETGQRPYAGVKA